MSDNPPPMMMSRDHALDALGELAIDFYNDAVRRGVKELPAREWAEKFRAWIDPATFERRHEIQEDE